MKALQVIVGVIAIACAIGLARQLSANRRLQAENEALRAEVAVMQPEIAALKSQASQPKTDASSVQEVARLRGEVAQLRSSAREMDAIKARNAQLQAQQLRTQSAVVPPAVQPAPAAAGEFTRESWAFSGYASPESALVSAIWAMREGNPKTYLDSLAPEEQARMSQSWANKDEAEIAAKHQSDVSKISSFKIVDRQEISPEQVTMSIYIGGVDRLEKVSMQKVGNDWKFGGFVREPKR